VKRHIAGHAGYDVDVDPHGRRDDAISVTTTMITPNQMGSKPRDVMTGKKMGIVSVIMASESIEAAHDDVDEMMTAIIMFGESGSSRTQYPTSKGIRVTARKCRRPWRPPR